MISLHLQFKYINQGKSTTGKWIYKKPTSLLSMMMGSVLCVLRTLARQSGPSNVTNPKPLKVKWFEREWSLFVLAISQQIQQHSFTQSLSTKQSWDATMWGNSIVDADWILRYKYIHVYTQIKKLLWIVSFSPLKPLHSDLFNCRSSQCLKGDTCSTLTSCFKLLLLLVFTS